MNINVYLRKSIQNASLFVQKEGGSPENRHTSFKYADIAISPDDGRFYYKMNSIIDTLPPALEEHVEEVTLIDVFPPFPRRISGPYTHASAKAALDLRVGGNSVPVDYLIHASGTNLKDVIRLYDDIRAGRIVPEPGRDWEQEQVSAWRAWLPRKREALSHWFSRNIHPRKANSA